MDRVSPPLLRPVCALSDGWTLLSDPDGNGVELYFDRPRAEWFDAGGRPVLKSDPIDYRTLLPTPDPVS